MYVLVEMPTIAGSARYGDVSLSSPTCVREKSPGATAFEPSPR
jgi:hypothetical protein